MKKLKRIIAMSIFIMMFFVMPTQAASNIEGKLFDVKMNVREDGVIEVHQTLDVYFNGRNQGIYVSIPQMYRDVEFDGVKADYFFPVKNFKMISNDEVYLDPGREGLVARIGTKGVYLTGEKRYEYSYEIHTRSIRVKGHELLYQNIVGNEWEFPIEKTTFSIQMPKPFTNEPKFYATNQNLPVQYEVNGNTITGSFDQVLNRQALTIWLEVAPDYFNFPKADYTIFALIGMGLFTAITAFLFNKFGRDPKVIETVEFTAPDELSSGEIGYIYRGHAKSEDIVSFIVYWASKGYLKIEELDEKGKNIRLTKLRDMESSHNPEEIRVFRALFHNRDDVTTDQLNEKFGHTVNHAVQNISKRFTRSSEERVFDRTSSSFKGFLAVLVPLVMGLYTGLANYALSLYGGDFFFGFLAGFVAYAIATVLGVGLLNRDGINQYIRSKGASILFYIVLLVAFFANYLIVIVDSPAPLWQFIALNVLYLVAMYAIANMGRRTQQGSRWYGQILGLERFIKVAEEGRLKALAEETPEIFYEIMPYAYVLGISDVWIKKFEHIAIPQPDWYQTTSPNFSTYFMMRSLNTSMNVISTSMVSVPAPKGSSGGGGSFGGGGFSGGGSSGGGFGGGGGGGW